MTPAEFEQSVSLLRSSLEGNLGNRLTQEVATGILNVFTARASSLVQKPKERKARTRTPSADVKGQEQANG